MAITRIPTQKRSIETRDKIIAKGFELICNNGYYKTNTPEIAKYAGVSTGIISKIRKKYLLPVLINTPKILCFLFFT